MCLMNSNVDSRHSGSRILELEAMARRRLAEVMVMMCGDITARKTCTSLDEEKRRAGGALGRSHL